MVKKNFYAVKYENNTGLIFTDYEEYQRGIKGCSNSSSKGFKKLDGARQWLEGRPYTIVKENEQVSSEILSILKNKKGEKYYAVARGRTVGVFDNNKDFQKSVEGYKAARATGGFKSRKEAQRWLTKNGISLKNETGIYAVAKGHNTGIFTKLHTYEKNMLGYPNAKGKKDFKNRKEALDWLNSEKSKKRYYVVAKGKRRGIYTDINKYKRNISGLSNVICKGGFKTREKAQQWLKKVTVNQKEYFAIAIGKRKGIYIDRKKYLSNLEGVRNSWGKDGFKTKEEAKKWLDERREFIDKHKDNLYKETIIAYESQKLPVVYTDGSYLPNKNQYSSSVVICEESGSIATFAKSNKKNRNNIVGELEALLYALKLVVGLYEFKEFIVVYDFDQLEQVARNALKIKGVKLTLQNEIVQLIDENKLGIHFLNVKSHTGIVGNSVADAIAKDINKHLGQFDLLRDLTFLTSV